MDGEALVDPIHHTSGILVETSKLLLSLGPDTQDETISACLYWRFGDLGGDWARKQVCEHARALISDMSRTK
jgi:hypothetical protein